jgi:hypothetical protein
MIYMKIQVTLILLVSIFLLGSCNDVVSSYYPTRAEAEADRLFKRGWLPDYIPASAREIRTSNNLDSNTSIGEFRYSSTETDDFLIYLKPYSGQRSKSDRWRDEISKYRNEGYDAFESAVDRTNWIFLLNNTRDHVRYLMWQIPNL